MTEIDSELIRRLVKGHKRDGRCLYDPQAKAEIVRACMQPGVSVARIAMQAGINANLVRTWIAQTRDAEGIRRNQSAPDHDASAAFVALRLAILVEQTLGLDPFATAVYVFSNRRRNRVKLLGWDRNGFWLLSKRLEQDRFVWPDEATVPTLTVEQLHWLLDGIDLAALRKHPRRLYKQVA